MKLHGSLLLAIALTAGTANAANLLGYYAFDGNYDSTGGSAAAAAPAQNPGEVSFAAGFRGQAANINDPSVGVNNSGGSINIPINANPSALTGVTFGGWVNVESFEFDGFMAIDNGGWDRGIHLGRNDNWGIASGGNLDDVAPVTTGSWQYVVGTFNKPGNATLYVGNADPGVAVTTVGIREDAGSDPGETSIEIGRYDNQDLDGLVDDIFVFGEELTSYEVNAIRNLRLTLDLSPLEANELFELYSASASGSVGGLDWSLGSGLDATNPGAVLDMGGGQYGLVLDGDGNGLIAVPEPSVAWLGGLAALIFFARRRRR